MNNNNSCYYKSNLEEDNIFLKGEYTKIKKIMQDYHRQDWIWVYTAKIIIICWVSTTKLMILCYSLGSRNSFAFNYSSHEWN